MIGNDAALMSEFVAIYQDEVDKIADAKNLTASVAFQPISTDLTKHFKRNGGNPLGLAGQGPLVCMCSPPSFLRLLLLFFLPS